MTPEQAFRARELSASGVWSGRIAEILGVDEMLVRRAIAGHDFREESPAPKPRPPAPPVPDPKPESVDPNAWPPQVGASTEWETVRVGSGPDRGQTVRVRWVMLWGQRVRINAQDEVWCHFCLRFKTTQQLSHPFNGCPVGLPHRGGLVTVDDTTEDDESRYLPGDGRDSWDLRW